MQALVVVVVLLIQLQVQVQVQVQAQVQAQVQVPTQVQAQAQEQVKYKFKHNDVTGFRKEYGIAATCYKVWSLRIYKLSTLRDDLSKPENSGNPELAWA